MKRKQSSLHGLLTGLLIASTMLAISAWAQYTIEWSTLDGGGGVATGGDFALRGTIGQPDAMQSDGGDYVLLGGFWVPVAIQTDGAPQLYIESLGITNVMIHWEPDLSGWVLQQKPDLLASNWVDSATGSTNPVSIPASDAARFYRLREE